MPEQKNQRQRELRTRPVRLLAANCNHIRSDDNPYRLKFIYAHHEGVWRSGGEVHEFLCWQ
jgi:hypothetical protein